MTSVAQILTAIVFPQVEVSSPNAEVESPPLIQADVKAEQLPVNTEARTSDAGKFLSYQLSFPLLGDHKHPSVLSMPLNHRANLFRAFRKLTATNFLARDKIEHRNGGETFQGFDRSFDSRTKFSDVRSSGGETNNTMSHVAGICAINKSE